MKDDAPDIVVIGVGNPHRGDDAAGLTVADTISRHQHPALRVCTSIPDATALLDSWQDADLCIVVDCAVSDSPAGTVHRIDALADGIPDRLFNSSSTHTLSVSQGLELGRVLGKLPQRLTVYGIEGVQFSHGSPMSPDVLDAVHKVASDIMNEINEFAAEVGHE